MKLIGNLIWFLLVGFLSFLSWAVAGFILCITVIGIPFGLQCFKIANLFLWPMGHTVTTHFSAHPIANLIWLILFGWEFCIGCVAAGILFSITIIGIPFGRQCFKLAELAICPFGAHIS